MGYLESINLGETDLDSKGRAFETFMGSFFRGDFGQYFTPRPIVKFIVDVLPIKQSSLVLDTSCGSGGFLLHALEKVRTEADEYYPNYKTDPKEYNKHYQHWHNFAQSNLFGIEINEQIARVAKMNMIIHDDGHTNVIAADGLRDSEDLIKRTENKGFTYNRFDFIITNPPFGSVIKQTEQAYISQYSFAMKAVDWLNPKSRTTERDSQSTEVLFLEQCHRFLKEGGYLAMVVPDGILTNSSLQYVREGIEEKYRIVAVVSMPQTAFSATGAGVKSSVLFLKKYSQAVTESIQQAKLTLQDQIKQGNDYLKLLDKIENNKKRHLKELRGFDNAQNLSGKALTDSELYKEWKKSVTAEYNDQIEALKESLSDKYGEEKQKVIEDYPIFMAIAEDIGYDATGKPTNNNELDFIGQELARFIESIESAKDSFFLSLDVDKDKIFLVNLKELEGRLDPFCYIPELVKLDKKVKAKTQYRLRHFSKYHSSGATPSKSENSYYSDAENGIPFVRVQNLSVTGELDQTDLVYISREIHESLLKRSQIREGDLLVKITGVGRMAIASVVPQNFEGNINQHIVVIRTGSKEISENLAAFLNLDTVEKLASKRATGGTRPALDYPALFSIPIISDQRIYEKIQDAVAKKKQKELEAQRLLDSIDDYLLGELGIELPEPEENTIKNRVFIRNLSEVSGDRFDAPAHQKELLLPSTSFPMEKLKNCVFINPLTLFKGTKKDMQVTFIPMENVSAIYGEADTSQVGNIEESNGYTRFLENDLIWAKITPCMQNGKSAVVSNLVNGIGFGSTEFHVFRAKTDIDIKYIYALLRLKILRNYAILYFSGSVGHQRVSDEFFKKLLIPLPPLEKQIEISEHITAIRNQAKQLQQQAKDDLEKAKQEVEAMILGDD